MEERTCFTCKTTKSILEFFPVQLKRKKRLHCKSCCKEYIAYKPKIAAYYKPFLKDGVWYKVCRKCKNTIPVKNLPPNSSCCRQCFRTKSYAASVKYKRNHFHVQLKEKLRARILSALKTQFTKKTSKLRELLGCDIQILKLHLESQFKPGMSWENHAVRGWHIDHIKPCASFDLTKVEEQKKCFHYTNLQPLWWLDNLTKSDSICLSS